VTAIDDLIRLVPPPAAPVSANGDWQQVESRLGIRLPDDFKQLIEHYGLGQFVDFITPLTPFGPEDLLTRSARRLLDSERAFRDRNPDKSPYAFYPEPGGLLEWAGTDNGDRLCWLTEGNPSQWTTVAWQPRGWHYDAHPVGAAGFLHGWLTGRLTTTVFGSRANDTPAPWFEPFRDLVRMSVKLSESGIPYDERLQVLRNALAPTVSRGGYGHGGRRRQDHFAAAGHGWRLTYGTATGHWIRIAFPPEDEEQARSVILDAASRMGCTVLTMTTHRSR
jgi:hypothetical protein